MLGKSKIKEEYSFDSKKKLATCISNLTNKTNLKKIKEIIFKENPNIAVNKNRRGVLMYFQNFSNDTYVKLDKYLKKIERENIDRDAKSITETSDQVMLSSEDPNGTTDYSRARTRLRYSNREKRLIKRRQYEKIISEKLDCDTSNSDPVIASLCASKNKKNKKINNNTRNESPTIFSKSAM
jgi:hypothetical protein